MRFSKHFNFRLPERGANPDPADIDDLTYDIEQADSVLQTHSTELSRLERDKATVSDFNSLAVENTRQHAELKAEISENTKKRHDHENKSIIDGITNALVIAWNGAVTHINNGGVHISQAERTLWNKISQKLDLSGGTLTGFLKLHSAPTDNLHAATKKYVDDSIIAVDGGDMLKAVYDTNKSGVVDNAERLGGNAPSFYEPAFVKNNAFNKSFGTAAGTVCQGNDSRLTDARPANGGTANTALNIDGGTY